MLSIKVVAENSCENISTFDFYSEKHSDNIFLQGIRVVQMSWDFVRFHEIINQREDVKKFLTNKKVLFLKKILSVPCTMDISFFSQQMSKLS